MFVSCFWSARAGVRSSFLLHAQFLPFRCVGLRYQVYSSIHSLSGCVMFKNMLSALLTGLGFRPVVTDRGCLF